MTFLGNMAPSSLVVDRRFGYAYCLHHQADEADVGQVLRKSLSLPSSFSLL